MKIPKEIKIAGFVWTIEKNNDIANEGSCYGSSHMASQKIFLDPNVSAAKTEQTLIHEILHAIWWSYGLKNSELGDKKEEAIVDSMSQGLYQVLNDNDLLK